MKRAYYVFFLLLLITTGLLSGCNSSKNTAPDINRSVLPASTQALEQALKLPDDKLADNYCGGLDLCLGDSLLFTDAKDIPSQTLFTFFCYITSVQNEYGGEYGPDYQDKKWYRKADDKYHVPAADIEEVLNRYFEGINFNPTQIDYYQAQTKEVVTGGLGGFGGVRFPKVTEKERINNDTLKLTIDYCDDQYQTVFYRKVYTIRFTADTYHYLSIVKV